MFCPQCGSKSADEDLFCSTCGRKLKKESPSPIVREPVPIEPKRQPSLLQDEPPKKKHLQRESVLGQREQVPDSSFSKFVDAPDPPLPFWRMKVLLAICSLAMAGWMAYIAYEMGTWQLLASGIRENVPGIPFIMLTLMWVVSAVSLLCSKMSKNAVCVSGICQLFSAGTAVMEVDNYPDDPMLLFAVASGACALIALVSAAGGININFDDQAF